MLLFHAGIPALSGGYLGVDAFFVLSGFLITSLLVREHERTGRISFPDFYARRIRRLLPAALVLVAATFAGAALLLPDIVARQQAWADGIASLLSVANIRFIAIATDYFAPTVEPSPFLQMWSLGVEEQFYLAWPALLALGLSAFHGDRGRMALATGVASAASLLLFAGGTLGPEATFYSLPTRAWELGIGALLALRGVRTGASQTPPLLLLAAAILLPAFDAGLGTLGSILACAAVALAIVGGRRPSRGGTLLASRPLRYLGKISYSLYLWHWPALVLLAPRIGVAAAVLLAFAAAAFSERFVEAPFRVGGLSGAPARRVLALGAASLLVGAGLAAALRPTLDGTIVIHPDGGTGGAGIEIRPRLAELSGDTPYEALGACYAQREDDAPPAIGCIFGDRAGRIRIALVGDSYAAQWYPALERIAGASGAALFVLAKTGCPQLLVPTRLVSTAAEYRSCAPYGEGSRSRLAAFDPDLIVTAYGEFALAAPRGRDDAREADAMRAGLKELLSIAPVAYIAPVPVQPMDPVSCLDAHRADPGACAADATAGATFPLAGRDRLALAGLRLFVVDPRPLFCIGDRCPLVDPSGVVRNRDAKHASATYAAWSWQGLAQLLREQGVELP